MIMIAATAPFKNLLVVLQSDEDISIPLLRAAGLCKIFAAKMTVFVSYHRAMMHKPNADLPDDLCAIVNQQRAMIEDVLQTTQSEDYVNDVICSWKQKTSLAISEFITESSFDLVVKAPYEQGEYTKLFRSGLDHYFVSDCPLPLWMIKPRHWDEQLEVLACVDMCEEDFDTHQMNKAILSTSDMLARAMKAQMHVVDCYYGEIGSLQIDYNNKRGFKRQASLKEQHIEKLKLYISEYSVADDQLHVEEGIPDDALPNTATALNAEVTVIGNNEDTNYIDRLFGDTAVALTKAMPCDILVLKPSSRT
jgi:nucleotide-binding universal stress UspA family protein